MSAASAAQVAGVRITHPERVMFPDARLTKLDLARYYERIGDWVQPHVEGRPLTLVRCPTGLAAHCFFMKHSKVWAPPALRRVAIQEKTKVGEYLVADSVAALVSLVQMDVLEVHTWNSRVGRLEQPDRIVFDIDPGADVSWPAVCEGARVVRAALEALDLESFVKTTGGRGLHVVVPIEPRCDWSQCLAFARGLAARIAESNPAGFTTNFKKKGRERRLLIDYLRNNRTNTSVAAFSMRAAPHAPVSVPIAWTDLRPRFDPAKLTVTTVPARLARVKDPWAEYWRCRQRLTTTRLRAVGAGAGAGG